MAPTPKKEIERQHAAATALIDGNMSCVDSVAIERGEIPLKWKTVPTVENPLYGSAASVSGDAGRGEEEKKQELAADCGGGDGVGNNANDDARPFCLSSRGTVDVGSLAALVREGYNDSLPATKAATPEDLYGELRARLVKSPTNLWDPANATQGNVHVIRPSHDAWGIKKIALVFCDDFLQDVYEMPWYHSHGGMREALAPVLGALGVKPRSLVRCLLAALPPGVTIPAHHDTGDWVRRTHRVHVPVIVTNPHRILFRCGPSEAAMERVSCHPGHIFEINNQGKHAVSNCSGEHRVHLILDYVDEDDTDVVRRRIRLSPGEQLLQTRRSIDRAADFGSRPLPSYLILGAQKAGTSSLYDYLTQHPLIAKARRRETHCLDWRWDENAETTDKRREHCHKFFFADELTLHPSLRTGDSTPSYLLDSARVIPRLREVFPHRIKLFVMTRDPVRRAKSHYEMVTSTDGTAAQKRTRGSEWRSLTFEEAIMIDMDRMAECGLLPHWDAGTGTVDLDRFKSFAGSAEEDNAWGRYLAKHVPLNTGSHSLLTRGLYELQLRSWYRAFDEEDILVLRMEDMAGDGGSVQSVVDRALKHLDLPPYRVADVSVKNARKYEPMRGETEALLRRFYEPYNRRLCLLLGSEWNDPWPHA